MQANTVPARAVVPANSRDERPVRLSTERQGRDDTLLLDWLEASCHRVSYELWRAPSQRWQIEAAPDVIVAGRSLRDAARRARAESERRDSMGNR
jgi:hypothetical protein